MGNESKPDSAGGIVVSGGGKVLMRLVANEHAGYKWTFAKTKVNKGELPSDAAARAVLEKTGYRTRVLSPIPEQFSTQDSLTEYFLMEADHPPVQHGWQTERVLWVRFDEADRLMAQTTNVAGRARDRRVLEAARVALSAIPYRHHAAVQPEDWSTVGEMAAQNKMLTREIRYSRDQVEMIRRGFFPTVMEQKWFIYLSGNSLRLHRSWTGSLIYDVALEWLRDGGALVKQIVVNRDPRTYSNTDDFEDLTLFEKIIQWHLLEPLEEPEVDGIVKALEAAMHANYLGSPSVVKDLVDPVITALVHQACGEEGDLEIEESYEIACNRLIDAYTSTQSQYKTIHGWSTPEGLGRSLKVALILRTENEEQIFDEGVDEDDLAYLIQEAIDSIGLAVDKIVVSSFEERPAAEDALKLGAIENLRGFVASVFLGINMVQHPGLYLSGFFDQRDWHFH